jgi:uncharacterized membrane protein
LRIKSGNGIIPLNILALLLIPAIIFSPFSVIQIILGLPFILFFPGYVLMASLFPRKAGMGNTERIALSLGMSIVVVSLIGLILNYTPWGITWESSLYSVVSFIVIMSIIAWLRRRRLPGDERFGFDFQLGFPGLGKGALDKALSITLVVSVVAALGMLGYAIAAPKKGEKFTEFYILGPGGKAADFPRELTVGEEGRVTVGITNNEHETVTYRLDVMIDGAENNQIGGITLEHGEGWEEEVSFTPEKEGKGQKVEFLLFKAGEAEPYLDPLRLWLDVKG